MHAVICASSVLRLVMDCSLSRPIIGPCCRFCRRCRIPHCPIVSSQHCFVKSWAIHRPSPQLSSAYCRASCCVLSHTHAADFRYCHVSYHPVATIQQCFSSAYSLMDFNPVTNLPHQKEVDVLIKPSLKHLCPSLHHFSQFKWWGRNWCFPRLTILKQMGKQKGSTQRNWLEMLDSAQFCYNLHRSSATEASPFELVLGAWPQTPMEISVQKSGGRSPAAYQFAMEKQELLEQA